MATAFPIPGNFVRAEAGAQQVYLHRVHTARVLFPAPHKLCVAFHTCSLSMQESQKFKIVLDYKETWLWVADTASGVTESPRLVGPENTHTSVCLPYTAECLSVSSTVAFPSCRMMFRDPQKCFMQRRS